MQSTYIFGVLKCNERTHGKKNGKLLYRFCPDHAYQEYGDLIVPYKNSNTSFLKSKSNILCAIIQVPNQPIVQYSVHHVYGATTDSTAIFDYDLHKYSLIPTLKHFQKIVDRQIRTDNDVDDDIVQDRQSEHIITIDPSGCLDFDDAIGLVDWMEFDIILGKRLSIYISNVPRILDQLKLWDHFDVSNTFRFASVYMPNKTHPMLPRTLSEGICSLVEKQERSALTLDIYIDIGGSIVRHEFTETLIQVDTNYIYNTPELDTLDMYKDIRDTVRNLNNTTDGKMLGSIIDSHDVIAYLMLYMNRETGTYLNNIDTGGIFRSVVVDSAGTKNERVPAHLDSETMRYMTMYRHTTSSYETCGMDKGHGLVKEGSVVKYAQITSPIRRFVDLVNMSLVRNSIRDTSSMMNTDQWFTTDFISKLNQQMKNIRTVQNDASLITYGDAHVGEDIDGVVISIDLDDNSDNNKYQIFVSQLGKSFRVSVPKTIPVVQLYSSHIFRIVYFTSNVRATSKVRLVFDKFDISI